MQYCQKTGRNLVQLYTQPFSSFAQKEIYFSQNFDHPPCFFCQICYNRSDTYRYNANANIRNKH